VLDSAEDALSELTEVRAGLAELLTRSEAAQARLAGSLSHLAEHHLAVSRRQQAQITLLAEREREAHQLLQHERASRAYVERLLLHSAGALPTDLVDRLLSAHTGSAEPLGLRNEPFEAQSAAAAHPLSASPSPEPEHEYLPSAAESPDSRLLASARAATHALAQNTLPDAVIYPLDVEPSREVFLAQH
jgi:hypothetical protein